MLESGNKEGLLVGHNGHTERRGELVCEQFKPFYLQLINQSISSIMLSITSSCASTKLIMSHKHINHIKRDTRIYVILIFIYGNGILQSSRLQSAPIDTALSM